MPPATVPKPVENSIPQPVVEIVPEKTDPQKNIDDSIGKVQLMFALSTLVPLIALVILPELASNALETGDGVAEGAKTYSDS